MAKRKRKTRYRIPGRAGGLARAQKLTSKQRTESARKAGLALQAQIRAQKALAAEAVARELRERILAEVARDQKKEFDSAR